MGFRLSSTTRTICCVGIALFGVGTIVSGDFREPDYQFISGLLSQETSANPKPTVPSKPEIHWVEPSAHQSPSPEPSPATSEVKPRAKIMGNREANNIALELGCIEGSIQLVSGIDGSAWVARSRTYPVPTIGAFSHPFCSVASTDEGALRSVWLTNDRTAIIGSFNKKGVFLGYVERSLKTEGTETIDIGVQR